ncbi:MAG: hypothetical protein KKF52_00545, partial [Nanoarchaeota archaeon]|nr:hypothetical protein [Nanoarchaeota archaeon]
LNMTARMFTSPSTVEAVPISNPGANVLDKYDIGVFDVTWAGQAANVKMVEIVPIIEVGGKQVTCSQTVEQYGDALGVVIDPCV